MPQHSSHKSHIAGRTRRISDLTTKSNISNKYNIIVAAKEKQKAILFLLCIAPEAFEMARDEKNNIAALIVPSNARMINKL